MIDIKLLQKEPQTIVDALAKRGLQEQQLNELRDESLKAKKKRQSLEEKRALQNSKTKLFGNSSKDEIELLKKELLSIKDEIKEIEESLRDDEEHLSAILKNIPNLPDEKTPFGESESDNVEIKRVLIPREFDFEPKEHWELGEQNGWIDFVSGVKIAKSRFSVLKKEGARLERALINYMIDFNRSYGFEEVSTPYIANAQTLYGTGQLPKFENDLFKIEDDEALDEHRLYLIPTAEVTLTNLYRDEILDINTLPIKLTAHTPCFRREAGSASRDTRGIIREHQFHKVELVAITTQSQSEEIHKEMIECASKLLESLELPHRLVQLCSGDLGFSAQNTVDIEVWLPAQKCYREISSISNTRDFQARRALIRYKDGKKNILAHTLNGSSLAVGRTIVAIMENHQNRDGTISIPKTLQNYM